jgi:hypothetical protein
LVNDKEELLKEEGPGGEGGQRAATGDCEAREARRVKAGPV